MSSYFSVSLRKTGRILLRYSSISFSFLIVKYLNLLETKQAKHFSC